MATWVAPTTVLAPGLFSTTTGWPSFSPRPTASRRPSTSVAPPAANGTTSRSGRSGHVCAWAAGAADSVARAVAQARNSFGGIAVIVALQRQL
ncbi:Tripartite tricarboxylate transporter family receptor domain protein (fragment) [Cupriavidus taiwanensis]